MVRNHLTKEQLMRTLILATTVLALAASAAAQNADPKAKTLTVGDKAPAIELSHTVKGESPSAFEDDHVYVVEFWATWCGPCLMSMPHLSELQAKYKDSATIIGISDEDIETVNGFMGKADEQGVTWNEKIKYTLTTDPDRSAYGDYMRAAGQRGIPTAFIVGKDAHVEWIGHPMSMDDPLDKVVNGTWDRDAFAAKFKRQQEQVKQQQRMMEAVRAAQTPDQARAVVKEIDTYLKANPDDINMQMMKMDLLLNRINDQQAAAACGDAMAKANWDTPGLLNALSWNLITTDGISDALKVHATDWATRADELTDHADSSIIDTLARCYFERGQIQKAIELQKDAIAASDPSQTKGLKDTLDEYKAALDKV